MSRYRTPLPGMLAGAVKFALDRALALDPEAGRALAPLDGRWIKFDLQGLGIELWIGGDGDRLRVRAESEKAPAAVMTGTPAAMLALLVPDADAGGLRIEGDARVAQQFQEALRKLDPDVEQGLSEYLGPLLGPQMYRVFVELTGFGRQAAATGVDQVAHWLREESALVLTPGEWRSFSDGVDRLREAVDRLERKARAAGA